MLNASHLRAALTVVGLVVVAVLMACGLTDSAPPHVRLFLAAMFAWALNAGTRSPFSR